MKTILFSLLGAYLLFHCDPLAGQLITLKARVVESNGNAILPFANVFNKRALTGTAANYEGYFELPGNQLGDTIVISYLGYIDEVLVLTNNTPNEIALDPSPALLGEVVVIADNDYLYQMINQARRNKSTRTRSSKTYFFLETIMYDEPVEIIEAYYNGKYTNYGTEALQIKRGRIGLKPLKHRYFSSTESSRLFSLYDVFASSPIFPDNPFSIGKSQFKKAYRLSLRNTYMEGASQIFVIDFTPKMEAKELFSGTCWIDKSNKRMVKFNLSIQDAAIHPFIPIGYDTLERVDIDLTKTYQEIDGEFFVDAIDFDYNLVYTDRYGETLNVATRAYSKAYDYTEQFNLPYFEFTQSYHEDYRNIAVIKYDSLFWSSNNEFRFYDRVTELNDFVRENRVVGNTLYPKRAAEEQQLQYPYIVWSKDRFLMKEANQDQIEKAETNYETADERYNFNTKLYLDVSWLEDSLVFHTNAILDPVHSFYHLKMSDESYAFMNMYFDLLEIQRRKLEAALRTTENLDIEKVEQIYQQHLAAYEKTKRQFIAKVNRGKSPNRMKVWNRLILEELGIDNLSLFELD